ncbi:MAG: hypothetical protein RLZZ511_1544 [Cyanobacteriota bacterium]|jgi:transposase
MKTIKLKILPTPEQVQTIEQYLSELTWLWNRVLANTLHNYCLNWYAWSEKKQREVEQAKADLQNLKPQDLELVLGYYYPRDGDRPKLTTDKARKLIKKFEIFESWEPFDFDEIIRCPLVIGNSPYLGVACRIAVGGSYWKKDESLTISYKNRKGETKTKPGSKLVEGDKPYTPIAIKPHEYPSPNLGKYAGRELKRALDWDNLTLLASLREEQGLEKLNLPSDFVGGLVKDFEPAWKAFLDPKLVNRKKPLFKRAERNEQVQTLSNAQNSCKFDFENQMVQIHGVGWIRICDRSWQKRVCQVGLAPKTYKLIKRPSGWYVCVVLAHQSQAEKKALEKRLQSLKKEYGEASPEYQEATQALTAIEMAIWQDGRQRKRKTGLAVGIDPGVVSVVGTDHGALFRPNLSRERISVHIERLQNRLSQMQEANDRQWKASGNQGKRPLTKNELKLKAKIARLHERGGNSSGAFNHKLSSRLVRTYDAIAWEDTQLTNLLKQVEAKRKEDGSGYEANGAAAKRGLNWSLRQRCLGDLKMKTKAKAKRDGVDFHEPPAPQSSRLCSVCGEKGQRDEQHVFVCQNAQCESFGVKQSADVNAAMNHRLNADLGRGVVKYQPEKPDYKRAKRFRKTKKNSAGKLEKKR